MKSTVLTKSEQDLHINRLPSFVWCGILPLKEVVCLKRCVSDIYYSTASAAADRQHYHEAYQIIYLCRGDVLLKTANTQCECHGPALIFLASLEPHSLHPISKEYERWVLSINPERAAKHISPLLLSVFSARYGKCYHVLDINDHKQEIDFLFRMLQQEAASEENEGTALWLAAMLQRVFRLNPALFVGAENQADKIVRSVCASLESDVSLPKTLAELAQEYYISESYLSHIFKERTGYSVNQYQLLCRLSAARRYLNETELSVSEIAVRCGFSDTTNFCRCFKQKVGCTPTAYRLNALE